MPYAELNIHLVRLLFSNVMLSRNILLSMHPHFPKVLAIQCHPEVLEGQAKQPGRVGHNPKSQPHENQSTTPNPCPIIISFSSGIPRRLAWQLVEGTPFVCSMEASRFRNKQLNIYYCSTPLSALSLPPSLSRARSGITQNHNNMKTDQLPQTQETIPIYTYLPHFHLLPYFCSCQHEVRVCKCWRSV